MVLENATDHQLLKLAPAGEEAGFIAPYRRWQCNIYRFSLHVGNSRSVAEDITQEVFLSFMNGAWRFDLKRRSFSGQLPAKGTRPKKGENIRQLILPMCQGGAGKTAANPTYPQDE